MKPQFYGLFYPHVADVARQLGLIGKPVLDVCVFIAEEFKFKKPTEAEIEKDEASKYLAKLESKLRRRAR